MLGRLSIMLLLLVAIWKFGWPELSSSIDTIHERKVPQIDIEYARVKGYALLDRIRSSTGLQRFEPNGDLEAAANAHAAYLVRNHEESHYEIEGHPGFTGHSHVERALKQGYLSKYSSENLSTKNPTVSNSIDGLFSAIYHRFGFLDPTMDEIGIGIVQDQNDTANTAYVYVMGNRQLNGDCAHPTQMKSGKYWRICKDSSKMIWEREYKEAIDTPKRFAPKLIKYPYDNQKEIPPVFYNEEPDPLPDYDVSGFPVSVIFNDYYFKRPKVLSFELRDQNGKRIESRFIDAANDPNARLKPFQFALLPLKRLDYDAIYQVILEYEDRGKRKVSKWQFRTRSFDEPFFQIDDSLAEITISPKSSNILYFPPKDAHDLLTNMQFPEEIYLNFIDHNTIRLTVGEDTPDDFTIHSDSREVHIHIAR